jgi:hypothetical protein
VAADPAAAAAVPVAAAVAAVAAVAVAAVAAVAVAAAAAVVAAVAVAADRLGRLRSPSPYALPQKTLSKAVSSLTCAQSRPLLPAYPSPRRRTLRKGCKAFAADGNSRRHPHPEGGWHWLRHGSVMRNQITLTEGEANQSNFPN